MAPRIVYGPPSDEQELQAYAGLTAIAFGGDPEEMGTKIGRLGPGPVRLIKSGTAVSAGLIVQECAQWFGGQRAPMAAISAVVTAPDRRSGGHATRLMRSMLLEMRERGMALSALYPASRTLYRRVGYEMAGARYELFVRPREIPAGDRDLPLRAARPEDVPAIGRMFARAVARDHGPLDWGSPGWQHALSIWRPPNAAYVVCDGERIEGFISSVIARKQKSLEVLDLFAATPRAARRLLTFLVDHRAQIEEVRWSGRLAEPMLMQLQEGTHGVARVAPWMLRILDVSAALEQRGYLPGIEAALHLDLRDNLLPANQGRWLLEVAGGRGRVRRGGRGAIRLDIRGLAALHSGYARADDLREWTDYLEAPARPMAALATIFPAGSPWMAAKF